MELELKFDTKRHLHTTQIFRLRKAVEHLYYFALLLGTSAYAQDFSVWMSWLKVGFDTSLKEGPPGVSRLDRIRIETQPDARWVTIRAESSRAEALGTLEKLLVQVQALRPSFQGKDDSERLNPVLANKEIGQKLMNPLGSVLQQHPFRAEESNRLVQAAQDSLVWLTDNDITGISVTVNAA